MSKAAPILIVALALAAGAAADSLFNMSGGQSGTLISEKKARFEVGDIVTVLVRETIDASTQSNTDTRKQDDIEAETEAGDNAFLVGDTLGNKRILDPIRLPNWKVETEKEHRGRGQTQRTNKLVTTVTCTVSRVYDNRNFQLEGQKRVTVNREDSTLQVCGVARAQDVSTANTIDSIRLANAEITLRGKGPLWNNQRRGIFTKVLDWFSPY